MSQTGGAVGQALASCALFKMFDETTLAHVLALDDATIAAIIAADEVEAYDLESGLFQVRLTARLGLLRQFRRLRPGDEYDTHRRAFDHVLGRLLTAHDSPQRSWLLARCMYHVGELWELSLDYLRWGEVEALIGQLTGVAMSPGDHCQLMIYEAYLDLRRQQYERCLDRLGEVLATEVLSAKLRANALITRGLCAMSQARLEAAQDDFASALSIGAAANDPTIQGRALVNQSWIHNELDQYEAALECSVRSLGHFEGAGDLYSSAYALYSIGNNALYLGRWELGREHLDRAAAIYDAAGMSVRVAMVEWGRGLLNLMLGDTRASKHSYRRVLREFSTTKDASLVAVVDALRELGLTYQLLGRPELAKRVLRRGMRLAARLHGDLRQALLAHRYSQVLEEQGARRAAIVRRTAAIEKLERLRGSTQAEELKLGLLGASQQIYEAMVLSLLEQRDTAAAFSFVERARARAFLDLLARRGEVADVPLLPEPIGLEALQQRLGSGVVVLEFFTVGVLPPGDSWIAKIPGSNRQLQKHLVLPPQIILFAITAASADVYRIAVNPNVLRPDPADPTPGWHLLTERKLRWLADALLRPVEPLLQACQVLYVIPHGPLHYIPFAALPLSDGLTLLDPHGPALSYAPSATLLVRSLSQHTPRALDTLALGYDDRGPAALLLAEREAQLVARRAGGQAHVGPGPKRELLSVAAGGLRWLHIAGHAVYRADDPMASYLCLGAGDNLDARTIMDSLHVDGALVTLNACTSGLSHVASGDELLGLPRAFLYAGAATIMCSLHEVDDLAAYILMVCFVENLASHLSPAAALRRAQLRLRACTRAEVEAIIAQGFDGAERAALPSLDDYPDLPFAHNRYWAPFIVVGRA